MLFTRSRSRSQRIRDAAHLPDRRGLARLVRRGRSRAEHVAEDLAERLPEMTDDVLSDLSGRFESWQKEAGPLVESVVERVPRRRRSRKMTVLRLVAGIAFAVGVAVVVYLIWQRRDTEPAQLIEQPDEPLATPGEPSPSANDPSPGSDDGPGANPEGDGRAQDEAVAGESFRVQPERETAGTRTGWMPANLEPERADESRESRARGFELPSAAPRVPSATMRDQLPRVTNRPTFLR